MYRRACRRNHLADVQTGVQTDVRTGGQPLTKSVLIFDFVGGTMTHFQLITIFSQPQIAKFTGTTWGPPGSWRSQMGPMLAPWTLLSGAATLDPMWVIGVDFWSGLPAKMQKLIKRIQGSACPNWNSAVINWSHCTVGIHSAKKSNHTVPFKVNCEIGK